MKTWAVVLIVIGVLIVAVCAAIGVYYLVRASKRKKGTLAAELIDGKLRRFAAVRSFAVVDDLTLKGKNGEVKADKALITFNHVILFNIRSECDTIYGDAKDPTWVSVRTDSDNNTVSRKSFDNPLPEARKANDALRRLLTANKQGKVQTEFYIVFGDPKTQLSIGKGMPVLSYKEFRRLLSRSKYSEDGPVDVKEVVRLLKG